MEGSVGKKFQKNFFFQKDAQFVQMIKPIFNKYKLEVLMNLWQYFIVVQVVRIDGRN